VQAWRAHRARLHEEALATAAHTATLLQQSTGATGHAVGLRRSVAAAAGGVARAALPRSLAEELSYGEKIDNIS